MENNQNTMNGPENMGLSQKFDRGNVFSDQCPSRDVLKHVTSRWAVLVLLALKEGKTQRFSELRRTINGVSEKMLAQTLQVLEQDGFVLRVSYPVVPPHVEYSLTDTGKQVSEHVVGLADWIESNITDILASQASQNIG
ncbi:winged helix-turn-helix transcriptional regulator [Marinomonas pollencensis]|uniref:HxlR family transcriptional regulator n=1 Tax=Marinomonas pollencensis TaxID=491954 RepID=A0A3E0DM18_9GAMM|nr:helix-turn-helix domain-containing protein [Marinomonas pollencensis]REG83858.1 HxlR family transcriptional regulator [Marinomonas pollencensis]